MNLYEAIFVRQSIRKYNNDALSEETLTDIRKHFLELPNLFGDVETDIAIVDNRRNPIRLLHLGNVSAPYYMIFYSREAKRSQMNVGFLMQHMALYLCTIGIGSCIIGSTNFRKDLRTKGEMKAVGLMAFGKSKGPLSRAHGGAKRIPMDELCSFREVPRQWMKQLLQAARMAPSSMNDQPWRFVVYDSRIHIFTKKHQVDRMKRYRWEEVNFGIMFANLMIAAEELWLDIDLIRLENISQKNFPNSQYVLSAIMRS